jgi:hydrogenase expression/formation protein HypE
MHKLISEYFAPAFNLKTLNDSAIIGPVAEGKLALTTDSYVISPLFFPGGDIGHLSICGTVNDLSVSGARPLYMTAGFIIEEGFPLLDLEKILASMKETAETAGITIVAGDTKVVDKGKGDGIFINTTGMGIPYEGIEISASRIKPGDKIILSGSVGNHGMSVMALRNNIRFEPELCTDARPLNSLVEMMIGCTNQIHMMRDPTRGGLATTLKEIANESDYGIMIHEDKIKVLPGVKGASDLLGLDPLYVANEGILVAFVEKEEADRVVHAMKKTKEGTDTSIIGEVLDKPEQTVLLKTNIGGIRIVDMLSGDQLPRIC